MHVYVSAVIHFVLYQAPEANLQMIQRGLTLLTSHLENFRKRYAFHLRCWQLDGKGIFSHQKDMREKQSSLVRLQLQPAGSTDKVRTGPFNLLFWSKKIELCCDFL